MTDYRALARQLVQTHGSTFCAQLAESPVEAIKSQGVQVEPFVTSGYQDGDCSCDGIFHPGPPPAIGFRPTPNSRRERFTLIHEFGHYAIRSHDDVLSELADLDNDGGRQAEERVCDAFAGRILIPDDAVAAVLDGGRPLARHIGDLYRRSYGSREACAVRLAEHLAGFGYVVIADPTTKTVRFASPSPTNPYPWRRGTQLPERHPLWRTPEKGEHRGQAPVIWPSGDTRELWIDAVSYQRKVHAVFVEHRHWEGPGLSILSGGVHQARPTAYSGTCPHCGAHTWGYRLHETCGELWCRKCKRCSCGAAKRPEPPTRRCSRCGLTKRSNLFIQNDGQVCVDCE